MSIKKLFDNKKTFLGLALMLLSHLGWIIPVTLIPLLNMSLQANAILVTACVIYGNVTYNLGMVLFGADIVKRLRHKGINLKWLWVQIGVLKKVLRKHYKRLCR
ncbi:hypothetical protein ACFL57_00485 [Candidatus Margulisiibacteriota bacterium]